jgi:hypothetical protein
MHSLGLSNTHVTDAGLEQIKGLSRLRWLALDQTEVTDEGIAHLGGLPILAELSLNETRVTAEGVSKLQKALPGCKITHSPRAVGRE